MTAARLRRACLALPGAEETFPFGPENSVFKVAGKMFAISRLGSEPPLRVSLKCEPELAEGLRAAHEAIIPGYHLNKRHWNTLILDGSLPEEMVLAMIEDSYDLVVAKLPKATRAQLGWTDDVSSRAG
jgi:predicted DNA-binding protein (MmcQ/YjbR family)